MPNGSFAVCTNGNRPGAMADVLPTVAELPKTREKRMQSERFSPAATELWHWVGSARIDAISSFGINAVIQGVCEVRATVFAI